MSDRHEPRIDPLWGNVILWVGFVVLVVIGIVTVIVPELRDEEPPAGAADAGTAAGPAAPQ
jgi:hypothetical protein